MTIVGSIITLALAALVGFFLRCYVFSSSTGRHALDVAECDRYIDVEFAEVEEIVYAPVGGEVIDQCGIGLGEDDDFPVNSVGARPYLEEYWRTSGRHLIDQTAEFAAFAWAEEGDEYQSVSGKLELVA
ncbi:hypothetical protein [Amycolatopsis circi]|uniref:hypothetical protein n=1 Tax=Amycolatopsis circi TaxID=871959 RepID=UPI0013BE8B54|nr:hypothetical protein [Amycolatopsis circi]